MKYYLLKAMLLFLMAYSASAQSVLNLLDTKPAQIESYNGKNELTGGGILNISSGTAGYIGSLRDEEGQAMEFVSQYDFRNTADALELTLRFYVNPMVYALDLDAEYQGGKVLFPAKLSVGQTLPEVSGVHTFLRNEKSLFTEKSKLTNRKVQGTEDVEFRGVKSIAYIIGSTYEAERINRVNTVKSSEEMKEWYIPGTGIIKSERKNNNKSIIFRLK